MPLILGKDRQADADYLDTCRNKLNIAEYEMTGQVSAKEARELAAFTRELRETSWNGWAGSIPDCPRGESNPVPEPTRPP